MTPQEYEQETVREITSTSTDMLPPIVTHSPAKEQRKKSERPENHEKKNDRIPHKSQEAN